MVPEPRHIWFALLLRNKGKIGDGELGKRLGGATLRDLVGMDWKHKGKLRSIIRYYHYVELKDVLFWALTRKEFTSMLNERIESMGGDLKLI